EGRYFTSTQTYLLENLEEFPCSCSICNQYTPTELLQQNKNEQKKALAKHNLYVCQAEMRLIREAIRTGSLWELIEKRALAHPLIKRGFNILKNQSQIFIKNTPFSKQKGIFMVSNNSIVRPEVLAHKKKIGNILQKKKKNLLLISLLDIVIDDTFNFLQQINSLVAKEKVFLTEYEIWILDDYFGIIPLELIEVFPLIQYLGSNDLSKLSREKNLQIIMKHIKQNSFDKIIGIGNLRLFNKYYQKKPIFQKRNLIIETYNCTNFDDFLLEIKLIIEEL
ncbi:MAG: hypothetical protein U9O98_10705, partial [Asgard group archaeon]|nr:hypothetical protein [Asgard group archaeon]